MFASKFLGGYQRIFRRKRGSERGEFGAHRGFDVV
ncbi:MAG: hypothetical protein ACI8RC_002862, partial [Ilumatobacter sp.]